MAFVFLVEKIFFTGIFGFFRCNIRFVCAVKKIVWKPVNIRLYFPLFQYNN